MIITDANEFCDYYGRLRERTMRVAALLPEDRLEERLLPGMFSPADLLRHLACIERHMYVETVYGRPQAYLGCGPELASGKAAVLDFVNRLHAESLEQFRALTPQRLNEKCQTPLGTPITVWKWLRALCEHEIHHRGQLYIYLAKFEIAAPPLFGLTSEEVAARAQAAK